MGRAAKVEHHIVGDVDQRRNRPLARSLEPALHPLGRRAIGEAANSAPVEGRATFRILDPYLDRIVEAAFDLRDIERLQRSQARRGEVAGDAANAHAEGGAQRDWFAPIVADAIARLYSALKEAGRNPSMASAGDARALVTPENWVRDYIQQHRNYYPALEEAAETLGGALSDPLSMAEPMRRRLKEAWGISARVVPQEELGNVSQLYDPDRRLFLISAQLRPENRTFGLAYQLALIEFTAVIDKMVAEAAPPDEGIRQLLHMSLANYAAGAIMMPYGRFLASAEQYRYSIDRLCGEYGANVEQVAHRLTTMGRPGARGVPFFMRPRPGRR